jgi:hypothetical protein
MDIQKLAVYLKVLSHRSYKTIDAFRGIGSVLKS